MLFGLLNASVSFQNFINDTLTAILDKYVLAYLDDIFIYYDTVDEHRIHRRSVLEVLLRMDLHFEAEKYEFQKEEVKYLVLIIKQEEAKWIPI